MPSRRRVLALASTTAVAGCLGDADSRTLQGNESERPNRRNETDGPPRLGNTETGSCPPHDGRVVCYDDVDRAETPMLLAPDAGTIEPGESIAFTLENGTDATFSTNFYDWSLAKRVDGEWYRVAPAQVPQPLMGIGPGRSHTWQVTVENESVESGDAVPVVQGSSEVTVRGLGGGAYGFSVDGAFGELEAGSETAFSATFALDADPLELTPTNHVVETERDGETLVVRADRSDDSRASLDGDPVAAHRLGRVDDAGSRLIVEQVVRYEALRDALAHARRTDAESIRVEEYGEGSISYRLDAAAPFEFRGDSYAFTDDPEK